MIYKLEKKILSMSPDERRKLGINKPTLWYMKKTLKITKLEKFTARLQKNWCNSVILQIQFRYKLQFFVIVTDLVTLCVSVYFMNN
jgi:hypothetical protein